MRYDHEGTIVRSAKIFGRSGGGTDDGVGDEKARQPIPVAAVMRIDDADRGEQKAYHDNIRQKDAVMIMDDVNVIRPKRMQ